MDNAQTIIIQIHKDCGTSDNDIAELLEVSREHINRIKRGKVVASEELTEDLSELLSLMHENRYRATRKHYDYSIRQQRKRARQAVQPQPITPVVIPQPPSPRPQVQAVQGRPSGMRFPVMSSNPYS